MRTTTSIACATTVIAMVLCANPCGAGGPYVDGEFRGRIAYSADGNHNDPDDWASSPVALAIIAQSGLKDRLVHFDYSCILNNNDPEWERTQAESVLGAAEQYGYERSVFHDCQKDLDGAVESIARAINASSAEDPLYFIVAGPMEVPYRGIERAEPDKRQFVYCISHSHWNDGLEPRYTFTKTKRDLFPLGIHWVQIPDQNPTLAFSRYGTPAQPDEFAPYFWMRDSGDPRLQFLWKRMVVSTRPDASDAGMAWFLVTGDQVCEVDELRKLLEDGVLPAPTDPRPQVRIEAESFQQLEGYELNVGLRRNTVSHGTAVKLDGGSTGSIHQRFNEPYTAASGRYDIVVRFEHGEEPFSLSLSVNGAAQLNALKTRGRDTGWTTHTVKDVAIKSGDEISVTVEAAAGAPARLDFVQLNYLGPLTAAVSANETAAPLDDPAALPGQLIVAGSNPGYLKYNGGGPAFLCGPDNPEAFLFLGKLNEDGTRSGGGQEQIIATMAGAGVNAFHCQMTRLRRCNIKDEGDDTHSPFIDHDPSQPLNEAVLDQWDGWISQMEEAGIIVHLEFYNDATDVELMGWTLDENGQLHPHERRFFAGIVNRFKHHKNILWGIEESSNKLPRKRVPHYKKLSELIAETDEFNHPIVQSFVTPDTSEGDLHEDEVTSRDYRDDPHVDVVTWLHVRYHENDVEAQHAEYRKYAPRDTDRFILMKNETDSFPRERTQSRRYMWSCAMTGIHTLEAYHHADRPSDRPQLEDDGRIKTFMEQTDFYTMKPADERAGGSSKWVLAGPNSYIAYTYAYDGPMGVKDLPAGTYELLWFDTIDGDEVKQTVQAQAGDAVWSKPPSIGNEVALSIKRTGGPSR